MDHILKYGEQMSDFNFYYKDTRTRKGNRDTNNAIRGSYHHIVCSVSKRFLDENKVL